MLCFFPWFALLGFNIATVSCCIFLAVYILFDWLKKNFPFLCLEWLSAFTLGWIRAESRVLYTSQIILLLLSAAISSLNTSDLLLCLHQVWCGMLWIMSCLSPSPYFSLLIILAQVHFGFICSKIFFHCAGSFRCFLAQSNLLFLFSDLHLVVNINESIS